MSEPGRRWIVNEAEVAAKVIEDEAIILNLSTGLYYSLSGVGAEVWERLAAGRSFEETVTWLADSYAVSPDKVAGDVEQLIGVLQDEGLILAANLSHQPLDAGTSGESRKASAYTPPLLAKHTDMADLLALDPPMPGLMDGPWNDALSQERGVV